MIRPRQIIGRLEGGALMERGSTKNSPREDDQLEKEMRGTLQGNRSSRAEEWRDPEPPADDDPDVPTGRPPG
jgi:hypothetical protein